MELPILSHKRHLCLQPCRTALVPTTQMWEIPDLLTLPECQACIDYAESLGFSHQGSRGPAFGEAHRDHGRVNVTDEAAARELWHSTGLAQLVSKHLSAKSERPSGLNPNLRFYRYGPGHLFGKHIDESMDLEDGKHTRYTVLVYLSGGVQQQPAQASSSSSSKKRQRASKEASSSSGPEATQQQQQPNDSASTQGESPSSSTSALQCLVGGATLFYGDKGRLVARTTPRPGLCLVHEHGENCLEHEAEVVRQGVKYVLRSDIVFES